MIKKEELISVGKFQKTHALKGELNMISDIDPDYYAGGNPMIVDYDGIFVPYFVESVRPKGSTSYLVKIKGVDSEAEASNFVNKEIYMLKKDAEDWIDEIIEERDALIGYIVVDSTTGTQLGEIEDVEDSTSNVLLIVKNKDGEELYIPFNEDFIVNMDEDNGIIEMDLPSGLLDINKNPK